jgi:hypothetical protein
MNHSSAFLDFVHDLPYRLAESGEFFVLCFRPRPRYPEAFE